MSHDITEADVRPADDTPVPTGMVKASYRGPIPLASELAKYNELVPDAAERIIRMAEQDGEHRRSSEAKMINEGTFSEKMGMLFAFSLTMIAFFLAAYFFAQGNNIAGALFVSIPVMQVITRFIKK